MANSDLSSVAKSVAQAFEMHMNSAGQNCYPSVRRVSKETSLCLNSVKTGIKQLESGGWIKAIERVTAGRLENRLEKGKSTIEYLPCWPVDDETAGAPGDPSGGASDDAGGASGDKSGGAPGDTPIYALSSLTLQRKIKGDNTSLSDSTSNRSKEDQQAAQRYLQMTKSIGGKRKKPDIDAWATTIRRMRERDELSMDEIFEMLTWSLASKFWFCYVLTPEKLRKHWSVISTQRAGPASQGTADPADVGCERIDPVTRLRCGNHPADRNLNREMVCDECWDKLLGNNFVPSASGRKNFHPEEQ